MKRKANQILVLLLVMVVPAISLAQPGPGPGGPEGVPLDDNMNLLFLVVGIAFAAFVTIKQLRKRGTTS